jgi:hypothetical protein
VFVFLLGGPGSMAILSAWKPEATGGGSSDAVAALLGAFTPLLVVDGPQMQWQWQWPAQLYAVFFAAYLTTVDLPGSSRRSSSATSRSSCSSSPVALSAPLLFPELVWSWCRLLGCLWQWRRMGTAPGFSPALRPPRWCWPGAGCWTGPTGRSTSRGVEVGVAVGSVWALSLLTWLAWVRLLGVDLVVTGLGNRPAEVGWASMSVVAVTSSVLGWVVLQMLRRRWPRVGARAWVGLSTIVAVASLSGPLMLAVGPTSRAALICLHLTCAASVVALLAPTKGIGAGSSEAPQDGEPVPTATVPLVGRPLRPA